MMSKRTRALLLAFGLSLMISSMAVRLVYADQQFPPRGRYIYDGANLFSTESRAMLSSTLLRIDRATNYEIVIATQNNTMTEDQMLAWFNSHGVGKKDLNNGAVLFIFPSAHKYFVAIGSRNDVVSVVQSSSQGARALSTLGDDPAFAVLSYLKIFDQSLQQKTIQVPSGYGFVDIVVDNGYLVAIWGGAIVLLALFLAELKNGVEKADLIVPLLITLILIGLFSFSVYSVQARNDASTTTTYGIVDSVAHRTGSHRVCVSTGKAIICHTVYDYYNDVNFFSYNLHKYPYTFHSEDDGGNGAYGHSVGTVSQLTVLVHNNNLTAVYDVSDNSGGVTVGDGVWGAFR